MTNAQQYYVTLLLVYLGVDIIAALGLNLQFGVTGILNFAFIIFQSVGAYTYALLTLGPPGPGNLLGAGLQTYFWGTTLPFPLPFIAATVVGAGLSLLVGLIVLPRLRGDYQAMAFLVVRIAYVLAYVGDKPTLRTILWTLGFSINAGIFFSPVIN